MYPFERFTEDAKRVLTLAQEEAERAHNSYIGTEHLLLGLMREERGPAAQILKRLGLEIARVRAAIESVLGREEVTLIKQIIPTSRVKKVIEIAFEEARRMGTSYVGTEHVLLALLIEGEGIAAHVLTHHGATLDRVRAQLDVLQRKRTIVLGGTGFIGRAIVGDLIQHGYQVLVVHRGDHEPAEMAVAEHLHADRKNLHSVAVTLKAFDPAAVIDTCAMTGADADAALAALPEGLRLVVLSSQDVYRAHAGVLRGQVTDPVPLDESSAVHASDKLEVEGAYFIHRATVCRLPMVYGEHDYQRREEFILRRVRAGRTRIPVGAGTWLWSRGYVGDVARGVRQALESRAAIGQVLNLSEAKTWSVELWARHILQAAASPAELVRIEDEALLPEDLQITASRPQHLLVSSAKARSMLGWAETDPLEAVRRSVRWHLEHPPDGEPGSFEADDRALAAAN